MLFINPAKERFGGMLSRYIPVGVPVSLGVLSAYLRKWGVERIRIVDEEITKITPENLRDHLEGLDRPAIIGISVLTAQAGRAYEIARMYKRAVPDCFVVVGGIHCTALPEEPLMTGAVDAVVRGEGEEILRQLYFALRRGEDWRAIRGISFLRGGQVVHNADGDLIDNLDEIPVFPYELFENPKYDMGFITGARGCPYKCTFCSQRLMTGRVYRWHSPKRILETLDILINKYHQKVITFNDDNFSVNRHRVFELCDAIVASGLHQKCSFAIQTRADNLYEEIMPALKKANFTTVGLGMETGVERLAKHIQKDQTVAMQIEKIALCKKYGMQVVLFMIYGFPTETSADRDESYRVACGLDVGYVKFNNLIPYPGTVTYDQARKSGRLHIEPGWANFNSTLSITRSIFETTPLPYVPEGTTEFELKRIVIRRNLQYYFQWKIIRRILTRDKGVGWISLPERWYLNPGDVFELAKTTIVLLSNLVFSFIPVTVGEMIFAAIKRRQGVLPPEDVKASSRSFKKAPAPRPDILDHARQG